MPALAMGVAFVGYSLSLWGYCLVRGYNVTLWSLMSPTHPPSWKDITASQIPSSQVFPSGPPAPPGGTQGGVGKAGKKTSPGPVQGGHGKTGPV